MQAFFVRNPSQSLQRKCGTRQFWRFENEFQHFENEFQLIFGRISSIMLKSCKILPFSKNFVNKNGIKRVTPLKFSSKIHHEMYEISAKWLKNRV